MRSASKPAAMRIDATGAIFSAAVSPARAASWPTVAPLLAAASAALNLADQSPVTAAGAVLRRDGALRVTEKRLD